MGAPKRVSSKSSMRAPRLRRSTNIVAKWGGRRGGINEDWAALGEGDSQKGEQRGVQGCTREGDGN